MMCSTLAVAWMMVVPVGARQAAPPEPAATPGQVQPGSPPPPEPKAASPDPAVTAAETYSVLLGQAWAALSAGDADRAEAFIESSPSAGRGWEASHILAWARHAAAHPGLSPEARQGWTLVGGAEPRVNIDIDPSSRWLAFGGADAKVHILDLATGTEVHAMHALFADKAPEPPKPPEQDRPALRSVFHAVFTRDGSRLVTGSGDGGVCVFETGTWKLVDKFREEAQFIASLAVDRGASKIVAVTTGKNATLWKAQPPDAAGKVVYTQVAALAPALNFGRPAAFTHDGARIALGGTAACDMFDAATGAAVAGAGSKLGGGSPYCMSIAFSPDGKWLATGCRGSVSKSVYLFGIDGTRVYEFQRHARGIQGLSFSPDSRRLLTTSIDGTARLLDAATGVELLKFDVGVPIRSAVLSGDGKYLALGTAAGVRLYAPPPKSDQK